MVNENWSDLRDKGIAKRRWDYERLRDRYKRYLKQSPAFTVQSTESCTEAETGLIFLSITMMNGEVYNGYSTDIYKCINDKILFIINSFLNVTSEYL